MTELQVTGANFFCHVTAPPSFVLSVATIQDRQGAFPESSLFFMASETEEIGSRIIADVRRSGSPLPCSGALTVSSVTSSGHSLTVRNRIDLPPN
jgi:hypothetical protein